MKLKLQLKFDIDKDEATDEETVSADTYLSVYGAILDQEVGGADTEFGIIIIITFTILIKTA